MRAGHVEGIGKIYDREGRPILASDEKLVLHVARDNISVSEGSSLWNMKTIVDISKEKGDLYITDRRLFYIRQPDPGLAWSDQQSPYELPNAIANAMLARDLKRLGARWYCEIPYSDVIGYQVKKRTYGCLFLHSDPKVTRKAQLWQRDKSDDKLMVLRDLLAPRLPVTEPEDRKGSFVLGRKLPFLGRKH